MAATEDQALGLLQRIFSVRQVSLACLQLSDGAESGCATLYVYLIPAGHRPPSQLDSLGVVTTQKFQFGQGEQAVALSHAVLLNLKVCRCPPG